MTTTRETADHAELARLAEAATSGDLDTVPNPPSEYGGHSTGWLECPCCAGQCEVQGATFTNFDGVAIGVQFFGIGAEFGAYEAFFRAANPATVLSLLSEIAALRGERDHNWEEYLAERQSRMEHGSREAGYLDQIEGLNTRATEAERKLAEAEGLLREANRELEEMEGGLEVSDRINTFLSSKEAERG